MTSLKGIETVSNGGHYYNEFDPYAAAWLRALIDAGEIPAGDVDQRSIEDIGPGDLEGYVQCHFFAGIGGWPFALRLAGVAADVPLWTGSCPCQPYSSAGKRKGNADARNLWPVWARLIRARRPVRVFGEQVENAIGHGWLDGVFADLEAEDYACGAVVLGAHSVGAPHIRQRIYWLADADRERHHGQYALLREDSAGRLSAPVLETAGSGTHGRLGDTRGEGSQGHGRPVEQHDAEGREAQERHRAAPGGDRRVGNAKGDDEQRIRECGAAGQRSTGGSSCWNDCRVIPCQDGKARRIESSLEPLAHGIPARVGRLRGYGNAIVPQTAAAFIQAYFESVN